MPWAADASRRKKTPAVIDAIHKLMERETAGDAITGLKWARKTTAKIARQQDCNRQFRGTLHPPQTRPPQVELFDLAADVK